MTRAPNRLTHHGPTRATIRTLYSMGPQSRRSHAPPPPIRNSNTPPTGAKVCADGPDGLKLSKLGYVSIYKAEGTATGRAPTLPRMHAAIFSSRMTSNHQQYDKQAIFSSMTSSPWPRRWRTRRSPRRSATRTPCSARCASRRPCVSGGRVESACRFGRPGGGG